MVIIDGILIEGKFITYVQVWNYWYHEKNKNTLPKKKKKKNNCKRVTIDIIFIFDGFCPNTKDRNFEVLKGWRQGNNG